MSVDEIITLDDNSMYVLLSESIRDGIKYFLASELINNVPSDNYAIFKEVVNQNELYVEVLHDVKLQDLLIEDFENKYDSKE